MGDTVAHWTGKANSGVKCGEKSRLQQSLGVDHAAAVAILRRFGLYDRVPWDEFTRRLDTPPANREVFAPEVSLASATLLLQMNCRWDYDRAPRAQLDTVECYPIVYVTPKRATEDSRWVGLAWEE